MIDCTLACADTTTLPTKVNMAKAQPQHAVLQCMACRMQALRHGEDADTADQAGCAERSASHTHELPACLDQNNIKLTAQKGP